MPGLRGYCPGPMAQEDVEVVKACFDALIRGDFEASIGAYARDTEWDDSEVRPDGGVQRGRGAVWDRVRTWMGSFSEYSFELEQVLDAGDEVVVLFRDRGRGKTSGVEVEHHWGLVITVEGGAITRTVFHGDPAEALKAAGLAGS